MGVATEVRKRVPPQPHPSPTHLSGPSTESPQRKCPSLRTLVGVLVAVTRESIPVDVTGGQRGRSREHTRQETT